MVTCADCPPTSTTPPVFPPPPLGSDCCLKVRYTCENDTWVFDAVNSECVDNTECSPFDVSCSDDEFTYEKQDDCLCFTLPDPLPAPTCDPHCGTTTTTTPPPTTTTTTSTTTTPPVACAFDTAIAFRIVSIAFDPGLNTCACTGASVANVVINPACYSGGDFFNALNGLLANRASGTVDFTGCDGDAPCGGAGVSIGHFAYIGSVQTGPKTGLAQYACVGACDTSLAVEVECC